MSTTAARPRRHLQHQLVRLIRDGRDVIVDFAFWQRTTRDYYRRLVEDAGGRPRLVYLKADRDLLRRRLAQRAQRFDANASFPIIEHTLDRFIEGFEPPDGEGEEVEVVDRP